MLQGVREGTRPGSVRNSVFGCAGRGWERRTEGAGGFALSGTVHFHGGAHSACGCAGAGRDAGGVASGADTARRMTRSGESRRLAGGLNTGVAATVPIGRERAGVTVPGVAGVRDADVGRGPGSGAGAAPPATAHRGAASDTGRRALCLSADPDSPVAMAGECAWTGAGRGVSSAWAAQPADIEMVCTDNTTGADPRDRPAGIPVRRVA